MFKIEYNMPDEEYHSIEACSNSLMTTLANKSPLHVHVDKKSTPALEAGKAIHLAVLQPDLFDATTAVCPEVDKRTKEGKQIYQDFLIQSEGKTEVSTQDFALYKRIQSQVWADDTARKFLQEGTPEVSVFWEEEGVLCKCRFDWISTLGVAVDLKTTRDANPVVFMRDAYKYGYHRQIAWYMRGAKAAGIDLMNMFIIAVEKSEPHPVCIFDLDNQSLDLAEQEINVLFQRYKKCVETDTWPGYVNDKGTNVHTLTLPYHAFAYNDILSL